MGERTGVALKALHAQLEVMAVSARSLVTTEASMRAICPRPLFTEWINTCLVPAPTSNIDPHIMYLHTTPPSYSGTWQGAWLM